MSAEGEGEDVSPAGLGLAGEEQDQAEEDADGEAGEVEPGGGVDAFAEKGEQSVECEIEEDDGESGDGKNIVGECEAGGEAGANPGDGVHAMGGEED